MALEKVIAVDKIEVDELGFVNVRTITRIMEDGNELSASFHRDNFAPGSDLTGKDPKVVAIASAAWTPEVVAAHQARFNAVLASTKQGVQV
jgi:hypothetical protein